MKYLTLLLGLLILSSCSNTSEPKVKYFRPELGLIGGIVCRAIDPYKNTLKECSYGKDGDERFEVINATNIVIY